MDNTVLDQFTKTVYCEASDVEAMVVSLANKIMADHDDFSEVALVGVYSHGFPLAERISKLISIKKDIQLPVGGLDVSVYRDDIESLGQYVTLKESTMPVDIHNKTIILVDDVVHHGRTARAALNALFDFGRPQAVRYCALIDRGERCMPIKPDYVGRQISVQAHQYVAVNLLEIDGEDTVYLVSADN